MKKHQRIFVTGKVQGVWFRASTQKKAQELGLCGIVKNEADGSVYIEVEGEEELLHRFWEWCHNGPPHAIVEAVKVETGNWKNYSSFDILR